MHTYDLLRSVAGACESAARCSLGRVEEATERSDERLRRCNIACSKWGPVQECLLDFGTSDRMWAALRSQASSWHVVMTAGCSPTLAT
jgi:hypothetical protein